MTAASLPPGWKQTTLGEIGAYHNGRGFKRAEWSVTGRPIIRIQNLTTPGKPFNYFEGDVDPRHEVHEGDLLLSWAATLDVFRWLGEPAVLNQHIFKVESWIDPDFHYFVLRGALDEIRRKTHGSGMVHITRDRFLGTEIALPPRAEQKAIADRLTALCAGLTGARERFRRADELLAQLRAAVLQDVILNGGHRVAISEIGDVFVGATPSRRDPALWDGDIPWVSSGEVAFCRIRETREHISAAGLGNASRRLHPPGTVLLAMIGEGKTRGQAAILDVAAAHNQNSAAIRTDRSRMLPEYLYYCLMAQYEATRRVAGGSQQPALNGKTVSRLQVPCPPIGHQAAAVTAVEKTLAAIDAFEAIVAKAQDRGGAALEQSVIAATLRPSPAGHGTRPSRPQSEPAIAEQQGQQR